MKSYLYWPVKFYGDDILYHITAKYLGDTVPDMYRIQTLLQGVDTTVSPGQIKLKEIYFPGVSQLIMGLVDPPKSIIEVNRILKILREDDYDSYTPHITVEKGYLDTEEVTSVGKLSLMVIL